MTAFELRALLGRCCAARSWVDAMVASAPWRDRDELLRASEDAFDRFDRADWLEAFAGHPRIGDLEALRSNFGSASESASESESAGGDAAALELAGREQAATASAPEDVLRALAEGNARYDRRFGHLFVVFATGKSAQEMLDLLEERLGNDPDDELGIAAGEQRKITRKRLADRAEQILSAGEDP